MDPDQRSRSFQERQRSLCMLSEFVNERERWIDGVLSELGWTRVGLMSRPVMVQCPNNGDHFLLEKGLEKHLERCRYASHGVPPNEIEQFKQSLNYKYDGITNVTEVTVDSSVEKAVSQYVLQKQKPSGPALLLPLPVLGAGPSSPAGSGPGRRPASLVDASDPPREIHDSVDPVHWIRYIKSWRLVPKGHSCVSLPLNQVALKGWLFTNIPEDHALSAVMGGEMQAVEHVLRSLSFPPLSPDAVADKLFPLLQSKTRAFVLKLWKFLCISRIQHEASIPNSIVEELLPLPLPKDAATDQQLGTGLIAEIQALASGDPGYVVSHTPDLPLPVECVRNSLSTEERKVLYDYVLEVSKERLGWTREFFNDPALFRDDTKRLKAQARALSEEDQDKKSHLEMMKEMRDYKRRRQKYRAKNVHITQKSIKDTFRDLIELRMEEIRAVSQAEAGSAVVDEGNGDKHEWRSRVTAEEPSCEESHKRHHHLTEKSLSSEPENRTRERRPSRSTSRERRHRSRSASEDRRGTESRFGRRKEKQSGRPPPSRSEERRSRSRSRSRERKKKSSHSHKHSHRHKHKH